MTSNSTARKGDFQAAVPYASEIILFADFILSSPSFLILLVCKAAIKGFNTQMTARIEKGESLKDDSVFQDLISDVGYSYYSGSPMVDAYQIIRDLDETALGKFCDALPGVSSWSFIYKLDSMLRDLLRNAIYTCHKFSLDMEPAAALAKTLVNTVYEVACSVSGSVRLFDGTVRKLSLSKITTTNTIDCLTVAVKLFSALMLLFKVVHAQ